MNQLFPRLRTKNSARKEPHLHVDEAAVVIPRILEATDDSLIVAKSWQALKTLTMSAEQFQDAYNIATNWSDGDKTTCFVLGASPESADLSVSFPLPEGRSATFNVTEEPTFLKTSFKVPLKTMDRALEAIESFPLPFTRKLPLSLIRRAVTALLIPKIRGILSLQPLLMDMAHELDLALVRKVSATLGVAFRRSPLLFLQLEQLVFAFPSIFRLNGELAIASLLRSLNHPLPPFRMLSVLTWVNWSCQEHGCCNPFDLGTAKDPRLHQGVLPSVDHDRARRD